MTLFFNLKSMKVNLRLRIPCVRSNFTNFFHACPTFSSGSLTVMPFSMSSRIRFHRRLEIKLATLTRGQMSLSFFMISSNSLICSGASSPTISKIGREGRNGALMTFPSVSMGWNFSDICQMEAYRQQQREFDDWIANAQSCGIKEFEACAKTYRAWRKEILNAFKYGLTNGPTEGFNNKIKVLKRSSYGIRNFKRFRTRILHCTS